MIRATLKPKKCRACGVVFEPARSMQKVCSPACAIALNDKAKAKKAAQARRAERKDLRERLEKAKTRAQHLKEAQAAVNAYVRIRDANDPCISCDREASWGGQWHASHYRSVGSNPALRFNLFNIHRACSICNAWLSGNLSEYRPRLIEKIGVEKVDFLEGPHSSKKYDIDYLIRLKRIFRERTRRIAKMQGRGVRKGRSVPWKTTLPDALLQDAEKWEFRSFAEVAEDGATSGF
ncbi:recombination protein NinG [Burkholderia gladioli]|uniref:recombination protein NinG n=1 Tax=Burkholderia gladioli TaxID=28095 RepID=UPI00164194DD|nr:recombination protein NinG [Burkholderia gladioli]